jgi:hypothetical protein
VLGRRLLEIVVYGKCCRIGGSLTLDDLAATSEVGDWKTSVFEAARTYAAAQGWLVIEGDSMRLTTAGSAAARRFMKRRAAAHWFLEHVARPAQSAPDAV